MHCSSVEACLLWKCCSVSNRTVQLLLSVFISDNRILVTTVKCDAQSIAWDILFVITTVAGNLCNKCPKWLLEQNSSYSDYFNAIYGLYWTAEPQEALWHCKQTAHGSMFMEGKFSNLLPVPVFLKQSNIKYHSLNSLDICGLKWRNLWKPRLSTALARSSSSVPQH